ncbi:hypothetical protein Baya_1654 [Bagarius yarrelli]|uniref:Uncharacterized protein n=1 Tax=Bagarius yarrelli TaxID=175774 RepID=A0A556TLS5_BAGYA|nr:hypothetical protein Baya_1654 [Bagarius yarrelli]
MERSGVVPGYCDVNAGEEAQDGAQPRPRCDPWSGCLIRQGSKNSPPVFKALDSVTQMEPQKHLETKYTNQIFL